MGDVRTGEKHARQMDTEQWFKCNFLIWTNTEDKFRLIKEANDLGLGMLANNLHENEMCRQTLIQAKNREIRQYYYETKAENRKVVLFYCRIKEMFCSVQRELHGFRSDRSAVLSPIAGFLSTEIDFFKKFTPVVFSELRCKVPIRSIVRLNYNLSLIANFNPESQFFELFTAVMSFAERWRSVVELKREAKSLLATNESVDGSQLLERCAALLAGEGPNCYVNVREWRAITESNLWMTAKINEVKALVFEKQGNGLEIQENIEGGEENPLKEELSDYANAAFAMARADIVDWRLKEAGIYLEVAKKIFTALQHETTQLDLVLGDAYSDIGEQKLARQLFKSSYQQFQHDEMDVGTLADVAFRIGKSHHNSYRYRSSVKWLTRALDYGLPIDTDALELERVYEYLVVNYRLLMRLEDAERVLKEWEARQKRVSKNICEQAAWLYQFMGQYDLAEQWAKKFITKIPNNRMGFQALADVFIYFEQFEDAEKALLRALNGRHTCRSDKEFVLQCLGLLRIHEERFDDAAKHLKRARILNDSWDNYIFTSMRDARLQSFIMIETGRFSEAEEKMKEFFDFFTKNAPSYFMLMLCFTWLTRMKIAQARIAEAEELARKALKIAEIIPKTFEAAQVYQCLGLICIKSDRLTEANEWLQKALKIQTDLIPSHRETARTLYALGLLLFHMENFELSEEYLYNALAMQRARKYRFYDAAFTLEALADIKEHRKDLEGAQADLEDAFGTLVAVCPGHPEVANICKRVMDLCLKLGNQSDFQAWEAKYVEVAS